MSFLKQLSLSPDDYLKHFDKWRNSYHARYFKPTSRMGTFRPAVHLMLLVGTVGYTMEWFGLGRYHVAHQHHDQEEGLKLLAAERAKHGGGHH